jgi:hypothetical protein
MLPAGQSAHPSPSIWRRFPPGSVLWLLLLIGGFSGLVSYQMRAGTPAVAPDSWPHEAGVPFDSQRCNLVMFAHPKCPCTEASLEELKIVLTQGGEEINSTICFFDPAGVPADWMETRLVRAAKEIPGLNLVVDQAGTIAARFGVMTSGQILMFNGQGQKIFAGGITSARGHAGLNRGRTVVLALARGEVCASPLTPVYGCELHDGADPKEARP